MTAIVAPPIIQKLGQWLIVRDDILLGGTKQRALIEGLAWMPDKTFVYAGPVQGYAQIALAAACGVLNRHAVLFVARRKEWHPRTLAALKLGAGVEVVAPGYLAVVRARARQYCEKHGAALVPFGLDCPAFRDPITAAARALNVAPPQVWSVAGSGMLTRALQAAWPSAEIIAVQVGRPADIGRARLIVAPERYEQPARHPPPFPACAEYDAKAWHFFEREARPGALFWNVAG